VEYTVLDRAGRMQLPREMTEPLGMAGLVRLQPEPDHIGVWPDGRQAGGRQAGDRETGDRETRDGESGNDD
jgi:putative ABC transport system ATP-binding protein